ncbi:uncharacterized protein VP01_372g2 [Puccinia sorghi]|uniref:Uncharacterized protein n=1 Tax=Puccinia sorghi TaxID=27349 RepID=A0A0L6UU44_9BASI|nr:uncharacterized protein VP01_372g2 [Puccinia sorghi]
MVFQKVLPKQAKNPCVPSDGTPWLSSKRDEHVELAVKKKVRKARRVFGIRVREEYSPIQEFSTVTLKIVCDDIVTLFPDQIIGKSWQCFFCEQCAKSKSLNKKSPASNSLIPREEPMDLLVSDVIGLVVGLQGNFYMLTMQEHALTLWKEKPPQKLLDW